MSNYAIFFDYENVTYRLPVNPEQIEISSAQAIDKYEILKSGQIAVPANMELLEYSFEVELPNAPNHYVETPNQFLNADYYLSLFKKWRDGLKPVRFISSNGIGDNINTLVLIEKMTITEKAGEEGDKYVSFSLLEYKEFGKKIAVTNATSKKTAKNMPSTEITNPKSMGSYVVKSGDCLWSIAMKYYQDGSQNTKIFNANKDKIKNPSLIYPGQKLVIPK
jgi:nucleoid-associated protein YgaU